MTGQCFGLATIYLFAIIEIYNLVAQGDHHLSAFFLCKILSLSCFPVNLRTFSVCSGTMPLKASPSMRTGRYTADRMLTPISWSAFATDMLCPLIFHPRNRKKENSFTKNLPKGKNVHHARPPYLSRWQVMMGPVTRSSIFMPLTFTKHKLPTSSRV